jgi:APA family basic amino acid/polyamine antiporter
VPLLFIAAYVTIGVQIAGSSPLTSIAGIAIALSGLPFFFWWNRRKTGCEEKEVEEAV